MKRVAITYETGGCFGGTQFMEFNSFAEGFKQATIAGLNYLICRLTFNSGRERKIFFCWDNVKILTYPQILEMLSDPMDIQVFSARKNKEMVFLYNGTDEDITSPRSIMSRVDYHRVKRILEPTCSILKKKFIYAC